MPKNAIAPLLLTLGCLFSTVISSSATEPLSMGYYPSYRTQPALEEIRADRFTHVLASFISAGEDGAATIPPQFLQKESIDKLHAAGAKVIFALGGGSNGEAFTKMVRHEELRARFVGDAVKAMKESGADGLAIDWEQPEARDKELTTKLIKELRATTKAANPNSVLILVVNANEGSSQGYDGPALRDFVDYLHVMSYDYHGPWNEAGHHSPLFASAENAAQGNKYSYPDALTYWRDKQKFRPGQILLGLAGYGRGFKVSQWGERSTDPSAFPEMAFNDIKALIGNGWSRRFDEQSKAAWLVNADNTDRISYDDEKSVAAKARWMKEQGLAGFFIWELSQEFGGTDYTLTAAAHRAWKEKTP